MGNADDALWDVEFASSDNGLHVAASWATDDGVHLLWSLDGGETWSTPEDVDANGGDSELYWSADGSTLFMSYSREDSEPNQIAVVVGTANGSSVVLGDPEYLADCSDGECDTEGAVSADGSKLLVTWMSSGDGISVAESDDGGTTWNTTVIAAGPEAFDDSEIDAQVVMSPNGAHAVVAWERGIEEDSSDEVIYVAARNAEGWSDPIRAGSNADGSDSDDPRLAMSEDGQRVAIAYEYEPPDGEGERAEVAISEDGGLTWSSPVSVEGSEAFDDDDPAIAMSDDGMTIVATFERDHDSNDLTYLIGAVASHDGGETWTSPRWVSAGNLEGRDPTIAISNDGHRVMIAWESFDHAGAWSAQVVRSDDGGKSWSDPVSVSKQHADKVDGTKVVLSGDGRTSAVAWHLDDYESDETIEALETASTYMPLRCEAANGHPFTDVSAASYLGSLSVNSRSTFPVGNHVDCLYRLGVSKGTSATTFSPDDYVTREQMAAFLARMHVEFNGETCTGPQPFGDVAVTSFAYDAIGCIAELGVTTGTSAITFSPADYVTREQMAAFLARMYEEFTGETCTGPQPFGDVAVTSFAYDAIGCVAELGVTTGTSAITFSPADYVTREQMAAFLARLWRTVT
ncbi:MAG: hypothetical protein HOJ56_14845 [Acidimicrobiaceae bacterium]|nr:hypothetical protein [Acidimicrobiaceae bacterium]